MHICTYIVYTAVFVGQTQLGSTGNRSRGLDESSGCNIFGCQIKCLNSLPVAATLQVTKH